jgi:hypothetical protein
MLKLTSTRDEGKAGVNFCVYGEAGIGKTTLCGTAPDPLIISAEGGLMSLSDQDIPVFTIKNRVDCNEIYDWLTSSKEAGKYQTVCIDSLSEIAEVLLTDEKKLTKDARQAYGVMNDEMAILVRAFRDLDMHVYFSCKMKKMVSEVSGAINYTPSVPGQAFLQALPYFFDELFVMRYGKLEDGTLYRYVQTQGDLQYLAKDRSGKLAKVTKPDITDMLNKIIGEK